MATWLSFHCPYRCKHASFEIEKASLQEHKLRIVAEGVFRTLVDLFGNPVAVHCMEHIVKPDSYHPVTGKLARPHPVKRGELQELADAQGLTVRSRAVAIPA